MSIVSAKLPRKSLPRASRTLCFSAWAAPACASKFLRFTFGKISGYPEFLILDSTSPAQIKAIESKLDLAKTIFIVSSKSGSTLEPNIFKQYFFERVKQAVGAAKAGTHFIAITDPGSHMQKVAESDGFRRMFFRLSEHRRPLFRSFEFRNDSRRGSGHRHPQVPRSAPRKWSTPAPPSCPPTKIPASFLAPSSERFKRLAATKSPSLPRLAFPISAPGSSNCSPNPPARTDAASFPWTAKKSARPMSTAMTASSSTCA